MENSKNKVSDILQAVVDGHEADRISLNEIKSALHERGFGFILFLFSLPLCIPLPLPPGATALPSIPLLLFSFQMLLGFDSPWLPKWLGNKTIARSTMAKLVEKSTVYMFKIERFMRPRFSFATSTMGERIIGFFNFIFSVSIAIPLPLTNMIPAIGIAVMSLGLISKDGVVVVMGIVIGTVGVFIASLVVLFGVAFVYSLFGIVS